MFFWLQILFLVTTMTLRPPQCPDHALGSLATLRSGDSFEGRPVEVFQHAWAYPSGEEVYLVRLLDGNGYLGATGCQLEPR